MSTNDRVAMWGCIVNSAVWAQGINDNVPFKVACAFGWLVIAGLILASRYGKESS